MSIIKSIQCRRILNSHVQFANEFVISFADGAVGSSASSQGETISLYEDGARSDNPAGILSDIEARGWIGQETNQSEFDAFLLENVSRFGRNNAYALSEAFFRASWVNHSPFDLLGRTPSKMSAPRLCLNILNGGRHAYTNPVLSDFCEYILVARSNSIDETILAHSEIQRVVRERLDKLPKETVNGHLVSRFVTADNRECVEFLLDIRESLGYSHNFDLWIDASAGNLWTGSGYKLSLTSGKLYTGGQFQAYWLHMINQYGLRFIEDPFREQDCDSWHGLTTGGHGSLVIGDDFYSSSPARIQEGARRQFAHGVLVKPNQAGTVSEVCKAIETAQRSGHMVITSHRSISTESTFLSLLTCVFGVQYIKIGPLATDYSSVMRLNEIIRMTGYGKRCLNDEENR